MSGSRKTPSINADQSRFLKAEAIQLLDRFERGHPTLGMFDKSHFVNWFSAVPKGQKQVILTEFTKIHLKAEIDTASREKNKPLKAFLQNYKAMAEDFGKLLIEGKGLPGEFILIEPDTAFKREYTAVFSGKNLVAPPPKDDFFGLEREKGFVVLPGGSFEAAVRNASRGSGLTTALAFGAGLPGDTQPARPRSHSSPDAGEVEFKLQ